MCRWALIRPDLTQRQNCFALNIQVHQSGPTPQRPHHESPHVDPRRRRLLRPPHDLRGQDLREGPRLVHVRRRQLRGPQRDVHLCQRHRRPQP